jgi:AraC-like DNA-binding protein
MTERELAELVQLVRGLDSLESLKRHYEALQRVDSRERQLLERFVADMLPGRRNAPTKRASLSEAFPQGVGKVHNNPAIKAALSAISHGGRQALNLENGWKKTGNSFTFQMNQQGGGTITCFIQGPRQDEEQSIEKYSPERQLDVIQGFGGLTLDVTLGILATMTARPNNFSETSYPRPGRALISAEHLLRYKGFGRRGQDRLLLEQQIQREMERVSSLWMRISEYRAPAPTEGKNPKTRGFDTIREKTPLFEMTEIELANRSLFPEDLRVEYTVWEVGVGSWGRAWWNHDNGTSAWVRNASQALIELPHTQPGALLAKKLALGAFICAGKNPARLMEPLGTTVRELLRNHVGLPQEDARGGDWARRERERLEAAVELLVEIGILERVEWPDGYGPADVARTKGWSAPWLAARITLYPAQPAPEQQPALDGVQRQLPAPARPRAKQPRASRKPRRTVARFAVDRPMARAVKEKLAARRDAGLPQGDTETLARHLGISRSHLSNALGGRFHMSREVYAALERFLKAE